MKISKTDIYTRQHKVASIKYDDHQLTSYSGLVVFQRLFHCLDIRGRLRAATVHLDHARSYMFATISELLIVHILLGFRNLREEDYYRDDPLVKLVLGLKRLPGVATLSRMLAEYDEQSVERHHEVNRVLVAERLTKMRLRRITLDFDGSVQSTKRRAQGTAVGFNKIKKGERSYYPLFCTVAQTGQVFDVLHRSGNVHDANGADAFVRRVVEYLRKRLPGVIIELRMDSAFFSDHLIACLRKLKVEYTISVPFMRFLELKGFIESRRLWWYLNSNTQYFEKRWKPKSWNLKARFLFIRKEVSVQQKGPIQLDLFEPKEKGYEFKVIVTNKKNSARKIAKYHEGRGYQEQIFGELKDQGTMDYVPTRKWNGNKIYLLCNLLAHNLCRELHMQVHEKDRGTTEKRSPLFVFKGMEVIRRTLLNRAGRITAPGGMRTLTMNGNEAVQQLMETYLPAA